MRDMQMDKTELGCLRAIILFNPGTLTQTHTQVKPLSLNKTMFITYVPDLVVILFMLCQAFPSALTSQSGDFYLMKQARHH